MIAAQRRNIIREQILENGSAKAEELARQFGVSEETIRRDFAKLEKEGFIEKNYGGAIATQELQRMMKNISPVQQRKFSNLKEKTCIGAAAAKLVTAGMRIFLDAGSTTWSIIRFLEKVEGLTIITNSLDIARDCAERDTWTVIALGGQILPKSMSMIGPTVEAQLDDLNVDIAFLGTTGLSVRGNCTSANLFEANIKKKIIAISNHAVLVADSSKLSVNELFTFARFSQFNAVIMDDGATPEIRRALGEVGADLIIAEKPYD